MTPAPVPSPQPPVVRLSRPGEVAALVPLLCGFVPRESLVVISLRGRRRRVGLTMRVDLPSPAAERQLARSLAGRLRADGAGAALVVVCTDAADRDGLPRSGLVQLLSEAAERLGVAVQDALLVRGGRWWSYVCTAAGCCPPEGTPCDAQPSAAVEAVTASEVLGGRAVLGSRQALVDSLAAPDDPRLVELVVAAAAERARQVAEQGRVAVGRQALRRWQAAIGGGPRTDLDERDVALLGASLADVLVRDTVLTWALAQADALLALLLAVAARTPAPHDAAVCTLVAWVAHVRGDGGLANVALDRALAAEPGYELARLARQALDGQVRPAAVRSLLEDVRLVLHSQHPWTSVEPGRAA